MDKNELIALGLSEEQAVAVSTALEAQQMIPKARFDQVNKAKKDLELQVSDFSSQLKTLQESAKGNEDLQNEIKVLQQAQVEAKSKYEQELKDSKISAAIQLALAGKVHDAELVSSLFDRSSIELSENGKVIKGLDEQLVTMKESKAFLFIPEKSDAKPQFNPIGVKPAGSNGEVVGKGISMGSQVAQQMNQAKKTTTSSIWG